MIRVREYECPLRHRHEHFTKGDGPATIECPDCHETAVRVMSAPRAHLEGITGDFPGAAMQWETKRAQKMRQQAQKLRDHGDEGWT